MGFTLFCCGLRGCRVRDNYSGNLHRGGSVTGGRLGVHVVVRVTDENLDAENAAIVLSHGTNHTIGVWVNHCRIVTLRVVPKVIEMLFVKDAVFCCGIFATCQILFITKSSSSTTSIGTNMRIPPFSTVVSVGDIILEELLYTNVCSIL